MDVLLVKLLATPALIGSATYAGRRWGATVNGLIVGLPLTTGPVSFILAHQYGVGFAAQAAPGNLAGQVSMCVFCLAYARTARSKSWPVSALSALAAYGAATALLNQVHWQLGSALGVLLLTIGAGMRLLPRQPTPPRLPSPPGWDIPLRMGLAAGLVLLLTGLAGSLGPQLSGMVSTFPVFGVVFAAFTHAQQGASSAASLLRGILVGSLSFLAFFCSVGILLLPLGIPPAYGIALVSALAMSTAAYLFTRRISP